MSLSKWEFSALLSTIVEIFDLKMSYQTNLQERHPTFGFTTDLKDLRECSASTPTPTRIPTLVKNCRPWITQRDSKPQHSASCLFRLTGQSEGKMCPLWSE